MLYPNWLRSQIVPAVMAVLCAGSLAGSAADTNPSPRPSDRFAIPASDEGLPGAGPLRRADWFQRNWSERRAAWAGAVEQD